MAGWEIGRVRNLQQRFFEKTTSKCNKTTGFTCNFSCKRYVVMPLQSSQKSSGKIVLLETEISLQLKYSVSRPVVVACQKDSGTTVEKCTQVKPVILTAIIFAV